MSAGNSPSGWAGENPEGTHLGPYDDVPGDPGNWEDGTSANSGTWEDDASANTLGGTGSWAGDASPNVQGGTGSWADSASANTQGGSGSWADDASAGSPGEGAWEDSRSASVGDVRGGGQTEAVREAVRRQVENALPRDAFYDAKGTKGTPGRVVRVERFAGWSLPKDVQAYRMVYTSRSAKGAAVVTSAAVVTPAGKAPKGGWPLIAWAHGTSGVSPRCAPTLMKDLYYGEAIAGFLARGYAVVATDYSGLGAGDRHEYATTAANANDVRYSVAAAREAVPQIGKRWVAVGHSQGGQAVWGAARQQVKEPIGELLGAVPLAPATPFDRAVTAIANTPGSAAYVPYVAYSVALQYGVKPSELLTDTATRDYTNYVEGGCLSYGTALAGDAKPGDFLRKTALDSPAVKRFIANNRYTNGELSAPLFVVSGTADAAVKSETVAAVVREQCAHGPEIAYRAYDGDHDQILDKSATDVHAWIADRFKGKKPQSTCS
ncbi:alpha/beta hydrolase [Actinocorallia sp. A-T 12471]|uniref:alpha/beta hydrolase n=1 Tax=Actinocorallia sp. A-T 12471 TaxID=3089813 RepID=UPI0029D0BEAC|nr:alpha/beta fold hydrolase [Actinocorallia sp. A-T 12471]MDX6742330.1 alpha/beta fold hydrolase [Actinocorallia sp. A-T 12471]